ncbi:hypothetical protein A2424_00700 [Candidatus Peribacteria bacterium RIFOXYC1_FULL_54_13]|nr:MAG: hypothetical protein A2198_04965 [Candidatus Peribacteria bacterium RIFOXYA1_FULL_56_14]OGJ72920.1 MAG: hypothetical protein A2217_06475 [Candidatus Peribacteria bacterium RIFOXYA2_FULL_55_28]OGJ76086.1 MAG: hypothetical protein A2327_04215 [Candidatus Peribacteria bacterium RIFOXYB2_FULL_54_17]OGJ79546.1 MAG: hypothetical protein A2424_00700 [Candidatus Peribacteria bacterium RIFOXYC1_FULL_54_13]OGJ83411.1 MAG: hypothetical protein A2598_02320 [Candidatus Peribacteria bacterium RIFOXYD
MQKAGKKKLVFAFALLPARFSRKYLLHLVEESLRDDRLVSTVVQFAEAVDHPVVRWILQKSLDAGHGEHVSFVAAQTKFFEHI